MQCLSPIEVKDKLGKFRVVPCGRCPVCLDNKRNQWFIRMKKEIEYNIYPPKFVTLTYAEEYLPHDENGNQCVSRSDVQNFFKKLRKKTTQQIKYYLGSEYGPETLRPHYHFVLFNCTDENIDLKIIDSWDKGFVTISDVNDRRIMYVAKYINKKTIVPENFVPPFSFMSKGLGCQYFQDDKIKKFHHTDIERMFCVVDGKKFTLPRYYKEKLYTQDERKIYAVRCSLRAVDKLEDDILAYYTKHPDGNYFKDRSDRIRELCRIYKIKLKKHGKI